MKIRNLLQQKLEDKGLWPQEAQAVLKAAEANPANQPMQKRWEDDSEDYPTALLSLLLIGVEHEAVRWLKANKPQHFALKMFEENN